MTEQAHARRTDPATSHRAAEAVTPGLNAIQRQVEAFARTRIAGFLDVELVEAIPDLGPSTLRTRRSELVDRNVILDSGHRRTPDGATTPHTVWIHRDFVTGAPPVCEPEEPISREDRDKARAIAAKLTNVASMCRQYGLTGCEGIVVEAAELLKRLAR